MAELRNCTTNFQPEVCGVNVIVDPQAQLGSDDDRAVIIGQVGAAATAPAGSLHQVTDGSRGDLFGVNSMLNRMIDEFIELSPTTEVWAYALPNDGTAGSAEVTFTGVDTATSVGIAYLWVDGFRYQASFDPAVDTNDDLAARFQDGVDSNEGLTATVAANVLTITTNTNGEIGGQLDVRTSYDQESGIISNAQVTIDVVLTDATGLPDLSGFADIRQGFEFVINPYVDDASISNVSDYVCGQWSGGANSRAYGVRYGTLQENIVFGQSANNALLAYLAVEGGLTPSYLESASYGAVAFRNLNCQAGDIAASLQGQLLPNMRAPEANDQFTTNEKAMLVEAGMGYVDVTRVNDVAIGRAVTTFTVRGNGALDESLRDVNKPAIIACISRRLRTELVSRYTGFSFRRDGVVGGTSNRVATLPQIRNFIISLAQDLSDENLIQDLEGFVQSLEINIADNGCIEVIVDPELVDSFCCLNVTLRTI